MKENWCFLQKVQNKTAFKLKKEQVKQKLKHLEHKLNLARLAKCYYV